MDDLHSQALAVPLRVIGNAVNSPGNDTPRRPQTGGGIEEMSSANPADAGVDDSLHTGQSL